MPAQVARPLPECPGCYRPMGRDLYDAQGLCGDCRADIEEGRTPVGIVDELPAFVIPGQLSLPTDGDAW